MKTHLGTMAKGWTWTKPWWEWTPKAQVERGSRGGKAHRGRWDARVRVRCSARDAPGVDRGVVARLLPLEELHIPLSLLPR